jgi:putative ABC transport system permease protein
MMKSNPWRRWKRWLPGGRERFRKEIREEIQEHVEQLTRDNIARGMPSVEARRAAVLRFGSPTSLSDQCQSERKVFRVEEFMSDVRFGLRLLRKSPGFTAVALITLALGIGANTAIFSLVHGVLLQELPFNEPDRLMTARGFSIPDYEDFRRSTRSFDRTAVWASNLYTVVQDGTADQIPGITATPELFAMLGNPALGRAFREDESEAPLAILSHELWQSRFGGTKEVLGEPINLAGKLHTIIGVMPRGFHFPSEQYKFWVTFGPSMSSAREQMQQRSLRIFGVVGHLAVRATRPQAMAEAEAFSQRQATQYPDTNREMRFRFQPVMESMVGGIRPALLILLGTVGFVLLIACANVANLLLARTASRKRELAVRAALGARRGRIVRQLLAESILLSCLGGAFGVGVAYAGLRWLQTWQSDAIPRLSEVQLNWTVLLFTFGLSAATGLLFGLLPAMSAAKADVQETLKEGGRTVSESGGRLRSVLVTAEIALALVVTIGAGLLVKSFIGLMQVDPGFQAENLITGTSLLIDYKPEQRAQVVRQMMEKIERVPGVEIAGAGTGLPPQTAQRATQYEVLGAAPPTEPQYAYFLAVTPNYLPALRTRLLAGRQFGPQDSATSPKVVIVSEKLVRDRFGNRNPIGQLLKVVTQGQSAEARSIVGVVADVRFSGLSDNDAPAIYTPYPQNPQLLAGIYLLVRTAGVQTGAVTQGIRDAVQSVAPGMYAVNLNPMQDVVNQTVATPRLNTSLLVLFAVLALILSATGIYGLIAYSVTQRMHEIGVRIALGARASDVAVLVLRQVSVVMGVGLAVGVLGGLAGSRVLRTLLFEVQPTDPRTFALVALTLVSVALLASYIPVRRATKVDPMVALRYE